MSTNRTIVDNSSTLRFLHRHNLHYMLRHPPTRSDIGIHNSLKVNGIDFFHGCRSDINPSIVEKEIHSPKVSSDAVH